MTLTRFTRTAGPAAAVCVALSATLAAGPAAADFERVSERSAFLQLVEGKTLRRTLISLQVTADGQITGSGAGWDVTGAWTWEDGYFCRDLFWGGDDLGYNCQEVRADGNQVRFTSDRGEGEFADFRLR